MRIGFLSHFSMNLYLFRLPIIKELIEQGHTVFVITPNDDGAKKLLEQNLQIITYDISRGSLNPLKEIATIYHIYKRLQPLKLDLLHTFTAKPNIYGALAAHFAKVPVKIATVTGLGSFYISNSKKAVRIRSIMETLYRLAFKKVSAVIFQNSDDLDYFCKKNILPRHKAFLVRSSGVDMEKFNLEKIDPHQLQALQQTINPENKKMVLMVARAITHKGVREYYQVAKNLGHKYLFVYIGGTDTGNPASLDPQFLEAPYVLYLKERWDVEQFVALCDLFVLPSYREGVPRTLLEASAMKKPLITTDTVGCKEVVTDGVNGYLVPVKDSEILQKRIEAILEDSAKAQLFGENAYNLCKKNFSVEIVVKEYLKVYEKFL